MKTKNKKGFSIGEVMLSVFIVGAVLTVVSGLMAKTLKTFFEDRDIVIAANLSQEGVELARNIRDNEFMSDEEFGTGLGGTDLSGAKNFIVERGADSLVDAGSGNEVMKFDSSNGYTHSSGDETKFSRRITISGDDEKREITSMVIWSNDTNFPSESGCIAGNRCVMTKSILTNWVEEEVVIP